MEIKHPSSYPTRASERSVQASHQSDRRDDAREADLSSRKAAASRESDYRAEKSSAQGREARFFALEGRNEGPVDSRKQVRAMRERVRQTYSEQENRAARDAIQERQAQNAQAEQRAQQNKAQLPIDLIA